jgi:hypothetical protein
MEYDNNYFIIASRAYSLQDRRALDAWFWWRRDGLFMCMWRMLWGLLMTAVMAQPVTVRLGRVGRASLGLSTVRWCSCWLRDNMVVWVASGGCSAQICPPKNYVLYFFKF